MKCGKEHWELLRIQQTKIAYENLLREKGGRVGRSKICTIAELYGVSVWDLFTFAVIKGHINSVIRIANAAGYQEQENGAKGEELEEIQEMIKGYKRKRN
jgi:hypothetical protein